MEIRKYQEEDRAGLIELFQKVFPDDPPHNEPSKVIDAKLAVDDLIFVTVVDDQVIGGCIAGYDGHRGWLYAVATSPSYRRSGIGQKLVSLAVQSLKNIGCVKVNLQIRTTNTEVIEFYKSLGFSTEERVSMGVLIE